MTRFYCWAMSHILTKMPNTPEFVAWIIIHLLPHVGHNHTGHGL